jgi:hypothetical protein
MISLQVALYTVVLIIAAESFWAYYLLFYDFSVRALRKEEMSPFYLIATLTSKGFNISPKMSDEAPKRFAIYLGVVSSFVLVAGSIAGLNFMVTMASSVIVFCALLEGLFDFCVGCKIYYAIQVLKASFKYNDRNFN